MTHGGYLVGGYSVTAVALLAYVARLRWRGRSLSRAAGRGPEGTTSVSQPAPRSGRQPGPRP